GIHGELRSDDRMVESREILIMTNEQRIALLDSAIHATQAVRDSLTVPPPSHVIDVTPGQNLQAAIDAAPSGATLRLAAGTYDGFVHIAKSITLIGPNPPPPGLASADCPVWLTAYAEQTVLIAPDAQNVSLIGIGFQQQYPDYELALVQGRNVLFDRCVGLGDPINGVRRGWRVEGKQMRFVDCYMNDVFRPGRDTCCIGAWQDCDGLEV